MPTIDLRYGKERLPFNYQSDRFTVLDTQSSSAPLSDAELGARIDSPIGSKPFEELIPAGETVLLVVPDGTRRTASGQVVNLLVRRLIANGTLPSDIRIIFATGIHRAVTDAEKQELLTPFIHQRIKTLQHRARDLMRIAGITLGSFVSFAPINGEPVELNRALVEHDHVIIVGGVSFHYFAGFTGGRKLICPGLASTSTIAATHKLAFDGELKTRRAGVGPALLDGNAVHEAFVEATRNVNITFSVNTITDDDGNAVDAFCGDWIDAHRAACESYKATHTIKIDEKRDVVIVSAGGSPHDINMIQAHKALDTATYACREGGTIVLLAECADGVGRDDLLDWFLAPNAAVMATELARNYQVNGQTAWSLLKKTEDFDVRVVTTLPEKEMRLMRLKQARSLDEIVFDPASTGYILPTGAKNLIEI